MKQVTKTLFEHAMRLTAIRSIYEHHAETTFYDAKDNIIGMYKTDSSGRKTYWLHSDAHQAESVLSERDQDNTRKAFALHRVTDAR